jgi:hypothetical protein
MEVKYGFKKQGCCRFAKPEGRLQTNSDIRDMAVQVLSWRTPNDLILEQQAISKFLLGQVFYCDSQILAESPTAL